MDRDPAEWKESGRSRVDEILREIYGVSSVHAADRFQDPGKCSECGYMIGNLSFPATCTYCGTEISVED